MPSLGVTVAATSSEIGSYPCEAEAAVEGGAPEALNARQAFPEVTGTASPGVIRSASGPNVYLHAIMMAMHVAR